LHPAFAALPPSMAVGRKIASCICGTPAIHGGRPQDCILHLRHSRHPWRSQKKTPHRCGVSLVLSDEQL